MNIDYLLKYKQQLHLLHVLYVEDNKELREETKILFSHFFKSVDACANGKEALINYTINTYDIVIADINMPVMDGLKMSKEIRLVNPTQAIILMSSRADIENLLDSIEIGVDGFILKSFSIEKMMEVVSKIAKNIFIQRELDEYHKNLQQIIYEKNKEILYKTSHDQLTNLSSNFALFDLLKSNKAITLVLLNIDHFGNINDSYGFDTADKLLIEVAKYLRLIKPANSEIYRLNSDEFVLVMEENCSKENIISTVESILSFFSETILEVEDNIELKISFSIGIANGSGNSVLNNAKTAIAEIREYKRGHYKFFDSRSKFLQRQQDNIYWIQKIKESIANRKLIPFFQPIINNTTGQIEKYECLARIEDDNLLIPPIRFMEAVKLTGMLSYVTKSVIEQSCEKFKNNHYEFSINVTNYDLHLDYLEDFLIRNLAKHSIEPSRVVLEILEDITTLNESNILEQLHSLRNRGFKIAIDDFGSESSNFSRLLEFSPDYLKIDGSFIKNILSDEKSRIITEAIVLLAHKSSIKVIAEFVHNEAVQNKIKELGIDYSQGYFFSEPRRDL